MLDSHGLAPYPELTFRFFGGGGVWGRGRRGDEAEVEAHRTGRKRTG